MNLYELPLQLIFLVLVLSISFPVPQRPSQPALCSLLLLAFSLLPQPLSREVPAVHIQLRISLEKSILHQESHTRCRTHFPDTISRRLPKANIG